MLIVYVWSNLAELTRILKEFSPLLMSDVLETDLKLFKDEEKYMLSSKVVFPSLFLPMIILISLMGDSDTKSNDLMLVAVNWLMTKLNPHWHNNIFVESYFVRRGY